MSVMIGTNGTWYFNNLVNIKNATAIAQPTIIMPPAKKSTPSFHSPEYQYFIPKIIEKRKINEAINM